MKITQGFALIILAASFTACSSLSLQQGTAAQRSSTSIQDGDVFVVNTDKFDMTIVGFHHELEILYAPAEPPTLKATAEQQGYRYLINGSYFHASREHAGWLSIYGKKHADLLDDKQLSQVAVLNPHLGYIDFPEIDLFDPSLSSPATIEFQTGPMVIAANRIDTTSINASINGRGSHLRTLLAYTEEDGMKYMIICRQPGTLEQIGEHLLRQPVFQEKTLWVVNLDGGSSTALFARDYPTLNFNVTRPLPILLGVK